MSVRAGCSTILWRRPLKSQPSSWSQHIPTSLGFSLTCSIGMGLEVIRWWNRIMFYISPLLPWPWCWSTFVSFTFAFGDLTIDDWQVRSCRMWYVWYSYKSDKKCGRHDDFSGWTRTTSCSRPLKCPGMTSFSSQVGFPPFHLNWTGMLSFSLN